MKIQLPYENAAEMLPRFDEKEEKKEWQKE